MACQTCFNGEYSRKNHQCSVCKFCTIYPHVLRRHIQLKHNGNAEHINLKNRSCKPNHCVNKPGQCSHSTQNSYNSISQNALPEENPSQSNSISSQPHQTSLSSSVPSLRLSPPPSPALPPSSTQDNSSNSISSISTPAPFHYQSSHMSNMTSTPISSQQVTPRENIYTSNITDRQNDTPNITPHMNSSDFAIPQDRPSTQSPINFTHGNFGNFVTSTPKTRNVQVIRSGEYGNTSDNMQTYDIRFVPSFKLFIAGASGSGKTTFVRQMLENIDSICQEIPEKIILVYSVWQAEYDNIRNRGLVDIFIQDDAELENKVNDHINKRPLLLIFDDLIASNNLSWISVLYMVQGRHNNVSSVFISQRMFINDQHLRNISANSSYLILFKNPRNSRDISELAKQMTPGKTVLKDIFAAATQEPYSYLFMCLTQTCKPEVKYLSHLFDEDNVVRSYIIT